MMNLRLNYGRIGPMKQFECIGSRVVRLTTVALFLIPLCLGYTDLLADAYSDTLKRAKMEDKPVALYFYSDYCSYCDLMDREVLGDREISAIIKTSLVFLRINADKQSGLARKYNIRGYPTTWLLEPSGKRIVQIPGYVNKKDYRLVLAYVKGKYYKKMRFGEFLKRSGVN